MSNIIDFDMATKPNIESEWPSESIRPCYRTYDGWIKNNGISHKGGLYFHCKRTLKNGDIVPLDTFICPPLHIDAGSRDDLDHNYGLLLRFLNRGGNWVKWCMPCEMVGGSSEDINKHLQYRGLPVDNMAALKKFFNQARPVKKLECALKTGWHDDHNFILPDKVIGSRDDVFFQADHDVLAEYGTNGNLDAWRENLSRLCIGNPLLLLQVSVAFAGALLKKADMPYIGFHVFGETSTGKTTGQKIAVSVWGGHSFGKTWNSTGNGLEALAAMYNDGLLALDELGNSKAKDVDNIIYMVANGKGKNRAKVKGTARKAQEWRVALLSNGEKTLEQHLKSEGITVKGGQSVRFLEVPVFGNYGALNDLHEFGSGAAFSVEVQRRVGLYYGAAGMAYLERLTKDDRDFHGLLNDMADRLKIADMCSQECRAVRAFALVAVAGELATEYGLTGWSSGVATQAIKECMNHWRNQKGAGNTDAIAILEAVRSYVDKYGDLRFTKRNSGNQNDKTAPTGERSGWFDYEDGNTTWLFHGAGLQKATEGHDFSQVKAALLKAGWLIPDRTGKASQQVKIEGKNTRAHVIKIPE